jgi:hypothetical protein
MLLRVILYKPREEALSATVNAAIFSLRCSLIPLTPSGSRSLYHKPDPVGYGRGTLYKSKKGKAIPVTGRGGP